MCKALYPVSSAVDKFRSAVSEIDEGTCKGYNDEEAYISSQISNVTYFDPEKTDLSCLEEEQLFHHQFITLNLDVHVEPLIPASMICSK